MSAPVIKLKIRTVKSAVCDVEIATDKTVRLESWKMSRDCPSTNISVEPASWSSGDCQRPY